MSAMSVHTVAGREAIRAKLEDIDAGLAQLMVYVTNIENENTELRKLLDSKDRGKLAMERFALLERLYRHVWLDGQSIYSDEAQAIVRKLKQD